MAKWGILKLHPSTKAMNKLTVTIRIIFWNSGIKSILTIWVLLNEECSCRFLEENWYFNILTYHAPLPNLAAVMKTLAWCKLLVPEGTTY